MTLSNNSREINPIDIWINGITQSANALTADNYFGYDFNGSSGEVYYTLQNYSETFDDDNSVVIVLNPIISGKVQLTTDVVSLWGDSDQIIFDFIAQQLNITLK